VSAGLITHTINVHKKFTTELKSPVLLTAEHCIQRQSITWYIHIPIDREAQRCKISCPSLYYIPRLSHNYDQKAGLWNAVQDST